MVGDLAVMLLAEDKKQKVKSKGSLCQFQIPPTVILPSFCVCLSIHNHLHSLFPPSSVFSSLRHVLLPRMPTEMLGAATRAIEAVSSASHTLTEKPSFNNNTSVWPRVEIVHASPRAQFYAARAPRMETHRPRCTAMTRHTLHLNNSALE